MFIKMKRNIHSKRFPTITYRKGEELYLSAGEANLPFSLNVEEELTTDHEDMEDVGAMLDDIDEIEKISKDFLKKTLTDKRRRYYKTVAFFMEFHRDEVPSDVAKALFPVENPSALSFSEMVDYLKIVRFCSFIDEDFGYQVFMIDLSFNPEITDEVLAIYFTYRKEIFDVEHES